MYVHNWCLEVTKLLHKGRHWGHRLHSQPSWWEVSLIKRSQTASDFSYVPSVEATVAQPWIQDAWGSNAFGPTMGMLWGIQNVNSQRRAILSSVEARFVLFVWYHSKFICDQAFSMAPFLGRFQVNLVTGLLNSLNSVGQKLEKR